MRDAGDALDRTLDATYARGACHAEHREIDRLRHVLACLVVTKLLISGMTCNHCVRTVGNALRAVPGVQTANVQLPDRAEIEHDDTTSLDALVSAVVSSGYEASHA
jgi:copper chaperone CopZ